MASTEDLQQKILDLCDEKIASSKKIADGQRDWWGVFKYTTIVITVLLTVISGLVASSTITLVAWVIPVLSGVAALASTFLAATRVQEQYLNHRSLQLRLEGEKVLFEQSAGVYSKLGDEARVRRFAERIVEMSTSSYEGWEQVIRDSSQSTPQKQGG